MYLQITHLTQKGFCSFSNLPPASPVGRLLDLDLRAEGRILSIYAMISSVNPRMLDHLRKTWEQDLDTLQTFTANEWEWDTLPPCV